MSYQKLAAISQQYRSLPDLHFPLERISQFANLLDFVLLQGMVGLSLDDELPPHASGTYHQNSSDAHWVLTANQAELNAAGIPYRVDSGSEVSSTSHSTLDSSSRVASVRPRALTGSANDNPRAPKRRANLPQWHNDIYGTPASVASEPPGLYSPARTNLLDPEDVGQMQLPPMQLRSAPANSPVMSDSTGLRSFLPPSRRPDHPALNVLPPINSALGNSTRTLPGVADIYRYVPLAPTHAVAARPPSGLASPAVVNSHLVGSPVLFGPAPPAPRHSIDNPSLFGPSSTANPSPIANRAIPANSSRSSTRSNRPNLRAPGALNPRSSANVAADPPEPIGWGYLPPDYEVTSTDSLADTATSPRVPKSERITTSSRATHSSRATSSARGDPLDWPYTQTTYGGTVRAPADSARSTASGTVGRLFVKQEAQASRPVMIARAPVSADNDEVIDLTWSSSPPEAATLFGPPQPEPLIKQESLPELIFDPQPEVVGPVVLAPAVPNIGAIPLQPARVAPPAPAPPVPAPAPPMPVNHNSWAIYPGGYEREGSPEALLILFASDRTGQRWRLVEDYIIVNNYFPLAYSKKAKKILRKALRAGRKSKTNPKNIIVSRSLVKLSETGFHGSRLAPTLHARLATICQHWQACGQLVELLGPGFNFGRPEQELIKDLNFHITLHAPTHPLFNNKFYGWTYLAYTTSVPGAVTWYTRMAPFLEGHPSYSPTIFRSGRVSPFGSDPKAFWAAGNDSDDSDNDSDGDNSAAGPAAPRATHGIAAAGPPLNVAVANHAASGVPAEAPRKGKSRIVAPPDNSVVEGSASSLPSAPSSVSEPIPSASAAKRGTHNPTNTNYVLPRQPVPPRSGNRTTNGGRSATGSMATHSPQDVSQAFRIELIREARQGASEGVWLLEREQELLKDARAMDHDLKAQRIEIQKTQMEAEMDLKSKSQVMDYCIKIQHDPLATDEQRVTASAIFNATLRAAAETARIPLSAGDSIVGSAPDPAPRSPIFRLTSSPRPSPRPSVARSASSSRQSQSAPPLRQPSQTPGAGPSRNPAMTRLSPRPGRFAAASPLVEEDYNAGYDGAETHGSGSDGSTEWPNLFL